MYHLLKRNDKSQRYEHFIDPGAHHKSYKTEHNHVQTVCQKCLGSLSLCLRLLCGCIHQNSMCYAQNYQHAK